MTRFVSKFDGRSYEDRCIDVNLLPLCFRCEITDLVLFYKCVNKDTETHIENFIQTSILREDHSGDCGLLLKPLLTRTETF